MTGHKFLQGTPLMRIYLRCLGAKIGKDAILQEFEEGAIDLVTVGPRASLGTKLKLANVEVIGNQVHVGRIHIGADAHIGNGCVIGHDTWVGDGVELGDLTAIAPGMHIPDWEQWDGTPAAKVGMVDRASLPEHPDAGPLTRMVQGVGYLLAYNLIMIVGLLPIFPAFYMLYNLDYFVSGEFDYTIPWHMVPLFAWPAALFLVFTSMAVAVAMRWLLMPTRVKPGRHSIFSWFYFRKWMLGLTTETLLETLNSLYATVFMRNWYRMMGTKIGRGTEISANFAGRYDLIVMGENNFIGDECIFGDEDVHRGWMILKSLETGDRCFFGNSAVVAQGGVIENDALLGVKSRLPDDLRIAKGETWFGSPSIKLPNRQKVVLDQNLTYEPPFRMRLWRMIFEAMHTSFPTAMLISMAYITADIIAMPIDSGNWAGALGVLFAAGIVIGLMMYAMSVAFKWMFMGVYRPIMKPMWSWWAMRTEAVSVFYGGLASKTLLDYLRGTPFLPWLLIPYGTKVGKGTWINNTDITEFDCITIGDHAVINMQVCPQTHLYEDRIMKVGRIEIGRCATIGSGSTILYDTRIGEFARVGPLTLVMKGEQIPPHSHWAGAPAQQVAAQTEAKSGTMQTARPQPMMHAAE
ncbi:MAG: Pls/PosA family non-ribosomal peptide synthetase, partial [Hyphomicrobiaceae bacterium]